MELPIPTALAKIKPEVKKLYYRGELDARIFDKCIAVVGSRRITTYGERVLEKLIPPLVSAGVTIVSGYMYGVDRLAHKLTLECGGKSVAVLGWGIDWGQEPLQKNLLFISEYEGAQKSQLWMFPQRNRIVAGLSTAVVVIEAALKSGSLITAQWALKYKRKLFAVPGPITSRMSEGTNMLIRDGEAKAVLLASDITGVTDIPKNINSNLIINFLQEEPLGVDELAKKLNKSIEEIGIELSMLQLKGDIIEREGKYYVGAS